MKIVAAHKVTQKSVHPAGMCRSGSFRVVEKKKFAVGGMSWVWSCREKAVNVFQHTSNRKITCMPVLDENRQVIGSVLMQDIFKAGIVR